MAVALLDGSSLSRTSSKGNALHASTADGSESTMRSGTALAYGDVEKVICGDERWARVPGVRAEIVRLG